jgi:hypothetical protein
MASLEEIHNGIKPQKSHFKEHTTCRPREICVDFDANLHNENGGFWASEAELVGVPIRILDELERGTGDNVGKFRVFYKWTIGLLIMEYAMDPSLRKKLFKPPLKVNDVWIRCEELLHDLFGYLFWSAWVTSNQCGQ